MDEILYPYLGASLATVVVLVSAWFSYFRSQREAALHRAKSERLPDYLAYLELGGRLEERTQKLEEVSQRLAQAEATIEEATTAREFLTQNAENIQSAQLVKEELRKTESDLVGAKETLASVREETNKVTQEKLAAEFSLRQAKEQTATAQHERDRLDAEQKRLRNEVAEREAQRRKIIEETNQALEKLGAARAELAGLDARRTALGHELSRLDARAAEVRTEVRQLQAEEQRLLTIESRLRQRLGADAERDEQDAIDDLRAPAIPLDRLEEPAPDCDEDQALASVATHLAERGLEFPRRVVDAFHTSLKVQDESPLLVLAGISGTGKSLLPQCYAAALGIHCEVVPVQPRWDGPQDLLGFYHHLEGRYKATRLTRALLQLDRHRAIEDYEHDLSDRMLMVVLDEMNLARVEYYFSEFLSRLETRRDFDLATDEGRARAAVHLELGNREGEGSTFELCVDRNVLFVGTINEDESTQTLSDKVVDRSNVLRFGRPMRLAEASRHVTDVSTGSDRHLPFSTWNRWIERSDELAPEEMNEIRAVASKVNDALGTIGRAFGHRTFRAMQAYVRHYPNRDRTRLNLALADQIEQRVLPKLRGIDPNEAAHCINEIVEIVGGLGDAPLQRAIEEARQVHSFMWQGLDRRA